MLVVVEEGEWVLVGVEDRGRRSTRGRGRGRGTVNDSTIRILLLLVVVSSEDEFVLTTGHERGCGDAWGRGHGTVSDGNSRGQVSDGSTSSEDDLLSSIQNRFMHKSVEKYPIGTKIKLGKIVRKCYNDCKV